MATYYRVVCDAESEMAGAGLGYAEIYGDRARYYRSRTRANARAAELNNPEYGEAGCGTYRTERREDGWDENDDYCAPQLAADDAGEEWTA